MPGEHEREVILAHFQELDFWRDAWDRAALVIVGSSVRGIQDEFADVDVLAFVPQDAYGALYKGYQKAVEAGRVAVLNPNAFLYEEFPLALISGINGHYKVHSFEEVEERVQRYDDIAMWIHGSGVIFYDPAGRYASLQQQARHYPEDVRRQKIREQYFRAYDAAISVANPLRRNDRRTVILMMADCVTHLLRLCCLLERRPFPYDKWLYREALQTQAGRELQPLFESFFAEISRPEIRRIEPAALERPGHRNADLESYPLHMLWRRAKEYLEPIVRSAGQ
jgi:hypothetical protein